MSTGLTNNYVIWIKSYSRHSLTGLPHWLSGLMLQTEWLGTSVRKRYKPWKYDNLVEVCFFLRVPTIFLSILVLRFYTFWLKKLTACGPQMSCNVRARMENWSYYTVSLVSASELELGQTTISDNLASISCLWKNYRFISISREGRAGSEDTGNASSRKSGNTAEKDTENLQEPLLWASFLSLLAPTSLGPPFIRPPSEHDQNCNASSN